MAGNILKSSLAITVKEISSEFRTRYMFSSVLLFILTVISIIAFSMRGLELSDSTIAALLWIIFFFISMTGLARSFIQEEERRTGIFLRMLAPAHAVYLGKLFYNILLSVCLNSIAAGLFFIFNELPEMINIPLFISVVIAGSLGLASATTIISSLISRSGAKNALLPALSFPVLLPLVLLGIQATESSLAPVEISGIVKQIWLMISYSLVIISASYLLFEHVWYD